MVLVEDHGLIAHALAAALSARGKDARTIDPATTGDLVAAVLGHEPALALVDLDLGPRGDSLELIAGVSAADVPVVVVTGVSDPIRRARCVEAGAVGVLGKHGPFDGLVAAVDQALDRGTLLSPNERAEHLARLRSYTSAEAVRLAPFERLTGREAEVLDGLMRGRSVEQVAAERFVSVTTVRTHVRGILTKLGVGTQLAAVAKAREAGWTHTPEG